MAKRAEALGANTFAFFTRNPRGGSAKPIEETDIAAFHAECARAGIDRLVAHAPYTLVKGEQPLTRCGESGVQR